MATKYDLAIVGGGPAGSSAAWQAAQAGLKVVCVDKAKFPREKACGDGLTPRGVALLDSMGLTEQLTQFHRIDGVRFCGEKNWQVPWPHRKGLPDYGYVARRTTLDAMLLEHAAAAGAEIRESTEVVGPIATGNRITGFNVKTSAGTEPIVADIVLAADGAYSPLKKAIGIKSKISGTAAVAIRAEMRSDRPDDHMFEVYPHVKVGKNTIPGYGWVFPLGGGQINVGIGYLTSYKGWRDINIAQLLEQFTSTLPPEWNLPAMEELRRSKAVQAWRLPMGFTAWPPWQPGLLLAGDALGAGKPTSGAGISKAIESGLHAARCAANALDTTGPDDLSEYARVLRRRWGLQYRFGRIIQRCGREPKLVGAAFSVFDHKITHRAIILGAYGWKATKSYEPQPNTPAKVVESTYTPTAS